MDWRARLLDCVELPAATTRVWIYDTGRTGIYIALQPPSKKYGRVPWKIEILKEASPKRTNRTERSNDRNERLLNIDDIRINLPAGLATLIELMATKSQCTDIAREGTDTVNVEV